VKAGIELKSKKSRTRQCVI